MISVHTDASLSNVGPPIACPACGTPVQNIAFSVNRHLLTGGGTGTSLIPDCPIRDIFVPPLVYGLAPCGCVANATWAGQFSSECVSRSRGYPPRALPEIDVDAEVAKLTNYLTRLYAYKSVDSKGDTSAINYWIVVVADEIARLTGTKVSVPPHVINDPKIREWCVRHTKEKVIYPAIKRTLLINQLEDRSVATPAEITDITRIRVMPMIDAATNRSIWVVTILGNGDKVDPVNGVNVYGSRLEAIIGAVNRFIPHDGDYLRYYPEWLIDELIGVSASYTSELIAAYKNMQRFFPQVYATAQQTWQDMVADARSFLASAKKSGTVTMPARVFIAHMLGRTPKELPPSVYAVAAPVPLPEPGPKRHGASTKRRRTIREIVD